MTEYNEAVLSSAEEAADRAEKLARVTAEEAAAKKIQDDRCEQAAASTRGVNEAFFEKQARRSEEARNNKPIIIPKKTNEEAIAASAAWYPYPVTNPQPISDPLMDRETEASQRAAGYTPPKLKTSLTLQPLPDPYPSSDPRRGMTEDLIIRMGMEVDPRKPAHKK
jgi:hypothetical protein